MALKILLQISRHCVKSSHETGLLSPGLFRILFGRPCNQQLSDCYGREVNAALFQNPEVMGMGVGEVKKKYGFNPKKAIYMERLEEFLLMKGADKSMVVDVIQRFPGALTRRSKDLPEVWAIWESVLGSNEAVLMVVARSPESFFRSGSVQKLSEIISFYQSLGLPPKILQQIMAKSPRTFSYSVEHHKKMVAFFREICVNLGGDDPEKFVTQIITNNIFILTRSTKRLKDNLETIQALMKLENKDLLSWIQDKGAFVLNICNNYLKDHFLHCQQKLQSLGCLEADVTRCIYVHPNILFLSPKVFTSKVNLLLEYGFEAKQIIERPRVLTVSLSNMQNKGFLLTQLGYDLKSSGPNIFFIPSPKLKSMLKNLSS